MSEVSHVLLGAEAGLTEVVDAGSVSRAFRVRHSHCGQAVLVYLGHPASLCTTIVLPKDEPCQQQLISTLDELT